MVRFSAALATFETDLPPLIAQWWESELSGSSGIPMGAIEVRAAAKRRGGQATTGQRKRKKTDSA